MGDGGGGGVGVGWGGGGCRVSARQSLGRPRRVAPGKVVRPLVGPPKWPMSPDGIVTAVRRVGTVPASSPGGLRARAAIRRHGCARDGQHVRAIRSADSRSTVSGSAIASPLTEHEHRGMRLGGGGRGGRRQAFSFGKGSRGSCHAGPNLTDERFHNAGVAAMAPILDPGRFSSRNIPRRSRRVQDAHAAGGGSHGALHARRERDDAR